jgi:NADPH-dependent glutamate synthase beta subunit-like oxidoreductase
VNKKPFLIACNKVVLANGGSDLVNRLGVKGENKSLPWLKYELPQLESAIYDIKDDEKSKVKPVLIIGAGLSAADAILACLNAGLEVIHVFRGVAAGFVSIRNKCNCQQFMTAEREKEEVKYGVQSKFAFVVHEMMRDMNEGERIIAWIFANVMVMGM